MKIIWRFLKIVAGCILLGQKARESNIKKISEDASDDIFSDVESRAGRYKRMSDMYLSFSIMYFPILLALIYTDSIDFDAFLNPQLLYLTPGLWEKAGFEFWGAFLFETPFALMRGLAWWFFPMMIVLFLVSSVSSRWQYQKSRKE